MRSALAVILGGWCALALAAPALGDPVTQPAAAPHLAVPDAASQAKKEKLVRDVFGNYVAAPGGQRTAIATKMIEQAAGSGDDPVAQFVLLKDAADLAASVGDAPTAMQAASLMAASYTIDAGEFKYNLLRKSATAAIGPMTNSAKGVVDEGLALANEAVAAGNYDLASHLMTPTEQAARNVHSVPVLQAVETRVAEIRWMQAEAARARASEEKLAKTPDDPEANLNLGRFFCFVKGDWKGLHGLARGSNLGLKAAALADLANPTATDKQVAVGDLWWDLAEKDKEGSQKALHRRAGHWYSLAAANPQLTGLGRALVEKRLAAIPPPGPGEMIATAQPASVDRRGRLLIWEPTTGRIQHSIDLDTWGYALAFSPDGTKLAAGGGVNVPRQDPHFSACRVYDVASGSPITGLLQHDPSPGSLGPEHAMVFSDDGRFLLTHSGHGKTARIWNLSRGGAFAVEPLEHPRFVCGGTFTHDGRVITACTDGTLRFWELPTK